MDVNIDIDTTFKVLLFLIVVTIVVALIGVKDRLSALIAQDE